MTSKLAKGEIIPSLNLDFDKYVLCCKYSTNKQHIAAGSADGIIRIFESSTGNPLESLMKKSLIQKPVTSVQFNHHSSKEDNSRLLATYADGNVILWNFKTGELIKELVEKRQTLGAVYHPKLSKFITVGDNSAIYLYDEETMTVEHIYEKGLISSVLNGHSSRVYAAIFHPHQVTEFVSGGWDNVVHFWDMRQSNSLRFIKEVHMCGEGLDISPSGRELLTCAYSKDNPLKLWHYQSGRLLSNIDPDVHKSMLYCGQWLSPDYLYVGGTDPSLVRIVSLKTLSTVLSFKGELSGVYSIDHYMKAGRTKKENSLNFKILFAIGKMLAEADISL